MTLVHVFPGQGSHRSGMGERLFAAYPHLVRQADAVVGYSVKELCLHGSAERLTDTRNTQCAMYVVSALSYIDRVRTTGRVPDLLAGHSLGELVALFAAGAYDFVTGVEIVAARAAHMADAGQGAMSAVLGLDHDRVRHLLEQAAAEVDIANINAPRQTVISGTAEAVAAASRILDQQAQAVVPLRVSGAFHSRHMAPAAEAFARTLDAYRFAPLTIPVVSNVTAGPYRDGEVADLLVRQLTSPVRWLETVDHLLDQPEPRIEEIGPGQVLTGLIRQIRDRRADQVGVPA